MRSSCALLIGILAAMSCQSLLNAQERPAVEPAPRDALRNSAGEFTYPGGMLFHTAFQGGYTTRFLLLKAALRSNELSKFFALDERQRLHVKDLQCVTIDEAHRRTMLDDNAQPDEQLIEPDYFAFLGEGRLRKLDILALRFDGYMALTRKSFAERLELSPQTREKIAQAAIEIRRSEFIPRFRWEFAARLPKDIKYRDCLFAARAATRLNLTIVDALTDRECERLSGMLDADGLAADAFTAAEDLATLPQGVHSLIERTE